jgi:hypothetical protein
VENIVVTCVFSECDCALDLDSKAGLTPCDYSYSISIVPWHDEIMKPKPEPMEGPEAFAAFDALVRKVLSVPHSVIMERESEYKKQAAQNPHKRGPKTKKSSR